MLNIDQNFAHAIREIEYAYDNTPFYKDHMEREGITINSIRDLKDIRIVPPTSKMHYRKYFPLRVLSKGFTMQDERLYRTQSSGTTGERLITMEVGLFYLKRALETLSVNPKIAEAFSSSPRRHIRYAAPNCSDVECANPGSTMADRLLKDGTLVLAVYHDMLTTPEKILDNNLREITLFKPSMYYIDATHLAYLSRYMKVRKYQPPVAPILSSYTMATRTSKRQIREVFGDEVPFAEFVSMSELGWIALQCDHGNLHINNKSYYIELVSNGKWANPGELGELYITTIDNGCTPKVRYKTGDIYSLEGISCPCGHNFPVVKFHGRLKDFIIRNGQVILTPKIVDDLIMDPLWLDMYQFKQNDENNFEISLVSNSHYREGDENHVVESFRSVLGPSAKIKSILTDYIPTERSGKFLSCISSLTHSKFNPEL